MFPVRILYSIAFTNSAALLYVLILIILNLQLVKTKHSTENWQNSHHILVQMSVMKH